MGNHREQPPSPFQTETKLSRMIRQRRFKVLKVDFRTLAMLVVPLAVAMTAQTAVAKPYHSKVRDHVAAYRQTSGAVGNAMDTGAGISCNDPNVYRDEQQIPYYDINPHGG